MDNAKKIVLALAEQTADDWAKAKTIKTVYHALKSVAIEITLVDFIIETFKKF